MFKASESPGEAANWDYELLRLPMKDLCMTHNLALMSKANVSYKIVRLLLTGNEVVLVVFHTTCTSMYSVVCQFLS